jgi:hypothetical protein
VVVGLAVFVAAQRAGEDGLPFVAGLVGSMGGEGACQQGGGQGEQDRGTA